ncbi:hypothetical protein A2U01_0081700, partial [Trifolium medium]|nr:hypothetical protein [Trifolium medium]
TPRKGKRPLHGIHVDDRILPLPLGRRLPHNWRTGLHPDLRRAYAPWGRGTARP